MCRDGREKAWGSGTVAGCRVGRGEEVGGGRRRAGVGRRRAIAYKITLRLRARWRCSDIGA